MNDDNPSPLELLAASIRDDPETWVPLSDDAFSSERATELADRIAAQERTRGRRATEATVDRIGSASSRSRGRYLLVAAAALVLAGVSIALFGPSAPSAHAAVSGAAEALGGTRSLEGSFMRSSPAGTSESTIRVSNDAFQLRSETTYADGHTEASEQVRVDDYLYETIEGRTTRAPADPEHAPAPFARSSSAVISAAASGSDVEVVGAEDLGDVTATRYDIRLGPDSIQALSELERNAVAWFEAEYPHQVDTMRVWISDGTIRQVEIQSEDQLTRLEFHSLGEEVRIEAPPGPYVD